MSWVKDANKIGEYHSTYRGFRIYKVGGGGSEQWVEERADGFWRVTKFIPTEFVAIDKTGARLSATGIEGIGYEIDKELMVRQFKPRKKKKC
jgi:hypothetical protein